MLGPLADNGGPTQTHALLPGSPAIDAAVPIAGRDHRPAGRPPAAGRRTRHRRLRGAGIVGAGRGPGFPDRRRGPGGDDHGDVDRPQGRPLAGVPAAIQVVSGPNAGVSGAIESTDADGRIRFTYTGAGGTGTDTIVATAAIPGGTTVVSGPTSVDWALRPPIVTGLQRLGFHARPTRLVVAFSEPMDPLRAEDLGNYRLVAAGPDRRFGTADDRALRVDSATYDAALQAITLAPRRRLSLYRPYQLAVAGNPTGGLTSESGTYLDGAGTGQEGTDYVATFGRGILVRPSAVARSVRIAELRQRWAARLEARRS